MAAFQEAVRNGFTIELDVHMTKDDVLVVFHDDNLVRMTSYNKIIEDCTAAELRELVLDTTKERIPALTEVLDYENGRVGSSAPSREFIGTTPPRIRGSSSRVPCRARWYKHL